MTTPFLENTSLETVDSLPQFPVDALPGLYAAAYELYRNGKYVEACRIFHVLALTDPCNSRFWMGLGACYQMQKNYPDAIKAYSAAAIQDSHNPHIHLHAAECFYHSENLPKALIALESSLITAKESEEHTELLPQLELLMETWSQKQKGICYG